MNKNDNFSEDEGIENDVYENASDVEADSNQRFDCLCPGDYYLYENARCNTRLACTIWRNALCYRYIKR